MLEYHHPTRDEVRTLEPNCSAVFRPGEYPPLCSTDSSAKPFELYGSSYTAMSALLLFVCFIGVLDNALVCFLVIRAKLFYSSYHASLLVLCGAGGFLGVLGIILSSCLLSYQSCTFPGSVCGYYGFFLAWTGIATMVTITAISIEWYWRLQRVTVKSFSAGYSLTIKVSTVWLYSFCVVSPPLFGWNRYKVEATAISCSVDWESTGVADRVYVAYLFFFGLVIPFTLMLCCYIKIVRLTRKLEPRLDSTELAAVHLQRRNMIKMIAVMVSTFAISWFPYSFMALATVAGYKHIFTSETAVAILFLAKSSICYNPVIYAHFNHDVRRALNAWTGRLKHRAPSCCSPRTMERNYL